MRRSTRMLACALLAGALWATGATAVPLAFVAEINGRVDVARSASKRAERATLGLALERGDRVQVATGASATLLFNDGNLVALGEKSSITVAPQAKKGDADAAMAGVFRSVSESVVSGSRETGLISLAPVRSGGGRAELMLAPRQTDLLEERPTFRWRALPGATRYRVAVQGDAGELWQAETSDTAIAYPKDAPALPPGTELTWSLAVADARGREQREENGFRIKAAEERAAIEGQLERIRTTAGGAAGFISGAYLGGQGLLHDAIESFRELSRTRPDEPGPHEALGQLYRAVGLMDLAAAELQTALHLSRQP